MGVKAGVLAKVAAAAFLFILADPAPKAALAQCAAGSVPVFPGSSDCILDPVAMPKFTTPLLIPPVMPKKKLGPKVVRGLARDFGVSKRWLRTHKSKRARIKYLRRKYRLRDYYEIAVRQFNQQILPAGYPETTVWSYGSVDFPGSVAEGGSFNYPSFTIEAKHKRSALVRWINGLVDPVTGDHLPHLLTGTVDQTVHWANPTGDCANPALEKDCIGTSQVPYDGPVPMTAHLHGARVGPESDGYPESWWLPAAADVICKEDDPVGGTHWCKGTLFGQNLPKNKDAGTALFKYTNNQRATTLWFHDHTLGMTRLNVYAGPAGFYLLRGGPDDTVIDSGSGAPAVLPGPAPALGDTPGMDYYEIPIVIQDRSFNPDGSLYYPDNRAYFEGLPPADLNVPFAPDSDVLPIWIPEAFFSTMVVNGNTWPFLEVEPRRYRFRFLNGNNSRFLILGMDDPAMSFWQIGADGGFLAASVELDELLMGPAERSDVIIDFSKVPFGSTVTLTNVGPDEPFGGGTPGVDFVAADPATTGQVMQFKVTKTLSVASDPTTDPANLTLPVVPPTNPLAPVRQVTLNEAESELVCVLADSSTGEFIVPINEVACNAVPGPGQEVVPFAPAQALLGTLNPAGFGDPELWMDPITENPLQGATETWEVHNFTEDAHPIHLHLVMFQVTERVIADSGSPHYDSITAPEGTYLDPELWETGWKDTVIAYPGEITRIQATFDIEGLYVWHCHILEHEDNEMMRPYFVGDACNSPVPVEGAVCP